MKEIVVKAYIYETESVVFDGGGVEIVIVVAENRDVADQQMLEDPDCWVTDAKHLDNVYKVEERDVREIGAIFRAHVVKRLDKHSYL